MVQLYVSEPVPPLAFTVAVPLLFPQVVFVAVSVTTMATGSEIANVLDSVHPLTSVTVTEYDPEERLVIDEVFDPPGSQEYEYAGTPPPGVMLAVPLFAPAQVISDTERVAVKGAGAETFTIVLKEHAFESVTVTVCDPRGSPLAVLVVCPLLHAYEYDGVPPDALATTVNVVALHGLFA